MGRLAIDKSSINVTIEPSVITVIYNSYPTTTTPVNCMTTSTVYIAHTPRSTISSQVCVFSQPITDKSRVSTAYTRTLTTSTSASNGNTNPSISTITITTEKSLAVLPTTHSNQSSLNSSVVVGGVMGYVIFFILGFVGTVGGFLCGRSSRRQQRMITMAAENAIRSSTDESKNQSIPLPMLPYNNDEDVYMEMDDTLKEEIKTLKRLQ